MKNIGKDMKVQSSMITSITDTIFRINDKRLICPYCPGQIRTSLPHITPNCVHFTEERKDAMYCTKEKEHLEISWGDSDWFLNFCMAASGKLQNYIYLARRNMDWNNQNQ